MESPNGSQMNHIDTDDEKLEKLINDQELLNRFSILLYGSPELHYHPELFDLFGEDSRCSDDIVLIWENKDDGSIVKTEMLDRDGDAVRDNVYVDALFNDAEPTVVQIAKLVAENGEPLKIKYKRYETLSRIKGPKADISHEIEFNYSDVAAEILKLARGLDGNKKFKDMSLAEIGRSLIATEK